MGQPTGLNAGPSPFLNGELSRYKRALSDRLANPMPILESRSKNLERTRCDGLGGPANERHLRAIMARR